MNDWSDWREVDDQLRSLAVRRAALDAEEARLLREAERLQIWRPLGMVSALDYMERVLGYAPRSAQDRLRVARALASLHVIEQALECGQLNFSAVRELTRVATPSTEAKWCARALGKNVRQIEELVAGHAVGDDPDDPVDPVVQRHAVTLELSAEVYARWRQAQTVVADERGERPDDDAFAMELIEARLERGAGEPSGRAKHQILMTLCAQCERGWQEGAGRQIAVDAATVERARCDAQYIGSTDDALPVRATQDIPPSVVRFVWRRDGGKCQTPGCRSSRGLEVHHIVHRALAPRTRPKAAGMGYGGRSSSPGRFTFRAARHSLCTAVVRAVRVLERRSRQHGGPWARARAGSRRGCAAAAASGPLIAARRQVIRRPLVRLDVEVRDRSRLARQRLLDGRPVEQ